MQFLVAAEVAVQPALDMVAGGVGPGRGLAAQHVALLDDLDVDPGVEEPDGGREPGEPAAHDNGLWHCLYRPGTSKIRTVSSRTLTASRWPSGLNSSASAPPSWMAIVMISVPVLAL